MIPFPEGSLDMAFDFDHSWLGVINGKIIYYARHNMGLGYELYTLQPDEPSNVTEAKAHHSITIYPNPNCQ